MWKSRMLCLVVAVFVVSLAGSTIAGAQLSGGLIFVMTFDEGSGNKVGGLSALSVEPGSKITTTWGALKR